MKRLRLGSLLITILIAPVIRADLLECVDPDVRATLITLGGSNSQVVVGVPANLPEFDIPDGFSLIGSVEGGWSRVAYKSDQLPDKAKLAVSKALEEVGYVFQDQLRNMHHERGFQITRRNYSEPFLMCGPNNKKVVTIAATSADEGSYIILHPNDRGRNHGCGSQFANQYMMADQHLPIINLPEDVNRRLGGASGGGGSGSYSSQVRFETKVSSAELLNSFNSQIRQQDWSLSANWSVDRVDGNAWTARRGTEQLTGQLQLISHSGSEYTAIFTVWLIE